MNTLLPAALDERRWTVIPARPGTKAAAVPWKGCHEKQDAAFLDGVRRKAHAVLGELGTI